MPRVTRAAQRAEGKSKMAEAPAASRESTSSWQIPEEEEYDPDYDQADAADSDEQSEDNLDSDEDQSMAENDQGSPDIFETSSARQLLKPLQQTADRVSRQVEEFAKSLDKFNVTTLRAEQTLWEEAERLLGKYKEISLSRKREIERSILESKSLSRSRQNSVKDDSEATQVQFEANLWSLAGGLISCDSPQALAESQDTQKGALERLHRYSSDLDIWQAFISSDSFAQECQEILGWLQETAASSKITIDEVISPLTHRAERGTGIWSAGWLYTKMAIKTQKGLRSWGKPLDPSNPAIHISHTRSIDSKPLVTQMDPDAETRESAALQPQDEFHEQAAWQAAWELLRRGQTSENCRTWWTERKEAWRAAATRGVGRDYGKQTDPSWSQKDSPWSRIISLARNSEWLERCKTLSSDGIEIDKYQSAVYGILSGDFNAPRKVCKTIDDNLYVYFNSHLIQRYQDFIREYQKKLDQSGKTDYHPQPSAYDPIRKYLSFAQQDDAKKGEFQNNLKSIEAALVSKDYEVLFLRQGYAVRNVPCALLTREPADSPVIGSAESTIQDPDFVRMIAHLQLLLKALGYLDNSYEGNQVNMENNIAAYIGWLQEQGKIALIPLYASKLSPYRAGIVMGKVLAQITDSKEREFQIKLMKQYDIRIESALDQQWRFANQDRVKLFMENGIAVKPVGIIEYVGPTKVKNIKVKSKFIGEELSDDEEQAVRSLEWFRYTDKENWSSACRAAEKLYQVFLCQGQLVAAKALAERASVSSISTAALGMDLSGADSAAGFSEIDFGMDGVPQEEQLPSISPRKKRPDEKRSDARQMVFERQTDPAVVRETLAARTQTWCQLEQLVTLLVALEKWNDIAEALESHRNASKSEIRDIKRVLTKAFSEVRDAMVPLLDEDYLSQPIDEEQGTIFQRLRKYYLPEILLAYNSVLYFAGHAISRTWLVQCMNLAQVVATTSTLTDAFVESGRMRELVTAFALSSQALLHANEAGGKKSKKDTGIDIWQIKYEDGPS